MNPKQVIQSIHDIYKHFNNPITLQEHQMRCAALAEFIFEHWTGPQINKEEVIAFCLLHDLGNVIKFDFSNPEMQMKILKLKDRKELEYWKGVCDELIKKYGKDEKKATDTMVEELGVEKRLKFLISNGHFVLNDKILESNDYELMICAYASQRVGPFGILTLHGRFDEYHKRYKKRGKLDPTHPQFVLFADCAFKIEAKIQEHLDVSVDEISDESTKKFYENF